MSKKRKERVKSLADARLFAKRIIAIMLVAVMLMSGAIPMPVESNSGSKCKLQQNILYYKKQGH